MDAKKLYEVALRNDAGPGSPYKILYVLADDEADMLAVEAVTRVEVAGIRQATAHVPGAGPSRVIGHTWGPVRRQSFGNGPAAAGLKGPRR